MTAGPGPLAALVLAIEVADDLVVSTAHDVHRTVAGRLHAVAARACSNDPEVYDALASWLAQPAEG